MYDDYILYGGLPLIYQLNSNQIKENLLNSIYSKTLSNDIKERHNIKNTKEFKKLTTHLSQVINGLYDYSIKNFIFNQKI